jgi:copper(I)-binding protein
MRPVLRTSVLALSALTLVAGCSSSSVKAPVVEEAWVRSNPNGMGAAYFTITMPAEDRLIAAEVPSAIAGRVEVHEVVDDEGRMLMREVAGGIPLPAGQAVELRPGGLHLMLLAMPATLEIGATVEITLLFAEAPSLTITAEVREGVGAGEGHQMDDTTHGHTHGGMHGGHPLGPHDEKHGETHGG